MPATHSTLSVEKNDISVQEKPKQPSIISRLITSVRNIAIGLYTFYLEN